MSIKRVSEIRLCEITDDRTYLSRREFLEPAGATLPAGVAGNREMAVELDVTEHTARRHTEKVMRKLRVNRRAEVEHALTGFQCAA